MKPGIKNLLYRIGLIIPDRFFVMLKYRKNFGNWPNLRNPQTFNEKLNWLKLYDHNPIYTSMVDKFEAKNYIGSIIGSEYIIPTYGIWDKAEYINFDGLPDKFVLKTTHDSGNVIICRDKSTLDTERVIKDMNCSLKRNFYAMTREWPYKNVKPRIIAERLLEEEYDGIHNADIYDYKFFCFNGRVKFMKIDFDRTACHGANYYNRDFEMLELEEIVKCPKNPNKNLVKPENFQKMIELSEKISKNTRFLRVDFYEVCGHIFFGEATFFPDSAVGRLKPETADMEIGKLLELNC